MEFTSVAARQRAERALAYAQQTFTRPICVAVVDAHGEMLCFVREDGAPLRSVQIAQAKAYTAARMLIPTSAWNERLVASGQQPSWYADPQLTGLPGGAPIIRDGTVIGAIGISGLQVDEDQQVADAAASD